MKAWEQGVVSETPTCELPANARRMQAAGERLGAVVRLVYGRCGDLDCGGSVSVRVAIPDAYSGAPVVDYVGVWHDGKWFTGGARGLGLGVGYRDVMSSLKLATEMASLKAAPIVSPIGDSDTMAMMLDFEAQAA